jgi:hypothetical protein
MQLELIHYQRPGEEIDVVYDTEGRRLDKLAFHSLYKPQ